MFRPLIAFAVLATVPVALTAQDKPSAAVQKSLSGNWNFDQSRSDTIGRDPLAGAVSSRPIAGGNASHAASGGGGGGGGGRGGRGGGGGGGGGGAAGSTTPTAGPPADASSGGGGGGGGGRGGRDSRGELVMQGVNPGAKLVIVITDSTVTLTDASGQSTMFKTDGRKKQATQMDGTVIETQSLWNGDVLQLSTGVAGVGTLNREYKISKDGKTLELKEKLDVNGRKIDKKLIFTRG